jgi:hypothetical protein
MSGEAFQMRLQLAHLASRHQAVPKPFTPIALLPPAEGDMIVEGYAAPVTVDREFTKFAARASQAKNPAVVSSWSSGRRGSGSALRRPGPEKARQPDGRPSNASNRHAATRNHATMASVSLLPAPSGRATGGKRRRA